MLLSLWADFWNPNDWVPAPPPVVVEKPTEGGNGNKKDDKYHPRADIEYWQAYEEMLRRVHETPVREDAPEPVKAVAVKREALVERAKSLISVEQLRVVSDKIDALTLQIKENAVKSRDEEDALLVLLL
jgi:hypothetical protein